MDETVIFWTCSTIAQTLAAAMALTGAFVVIYIDRLNNMRYTACVRLRTHWPKNSKERRKLLDQMIMGDYEAVAELNRSWWIGGEGYGQRRLEAKIKGLEGLNENRRRILRYFMWVALLGAVAMAMALLCLPWAQTMAGGRFGTWAVLFLMLLSVASIVFDGLFIRICLRDFRGPPGLGGEDDEDENDEPETGPEDKEQDAVPESGETAPAH